MSIGYGGSARIVMKDEKTVMYEYAPYNLNDKDYKNGNRIYDGLIIISKDALVEPEIHEKLKRMPSGRKKHIVRRVRSNVDYSALLAAGKIIVENSRYCWNFTGANEDIGMIAMRIILHIFDQYQDEGILPETVSVNY